jgi:site-specific DNA-cytosine methylase
MWDAPAFTMVGLSKLIHPDGERLLTWREGMRLMSFPDSHQDPHVPG